MWKIRVKFKNDLTLTLAEYETEEQANEAMGHFIRAFTIEVTVTHESSIKKLWIVNPDNDN